MRSVANDAQINAAIATSSGLNISSANMLVLLERAIAGALVDNSGGPYVAGTASDGTSITFASLADMIAARAYYRKTAIEDAGPQTLNVEFATADSSGSGGGYNS